MFQRKEQILKKTGPAGIGRHDFLKLLKEEYEQTNSEEARKEVLANLANFCYDPINYEFIKLLKIVDIFLEQLLQSENQFLLEYSIAGVCNLSSDPELQIYIIKKNGINLISKHLTNSNTELIINALTALILLITAESHATITSPDNIQVIWKYRNCDDVRLKNLSEIFITDYCTNEQVVFATK